MRIQLFGDLDELQALVQYLDNAGVERSLAHYTSLAEGWRCELTAHPRFYTEQEVKDLGGDFVRIGEDKFIPVKG